MQKKLSLIFSILSVVFLPSVLQAQEPEVINLRDSLDKMGYYVKPLHHKDSVHFTNEEALKYLQAKYSSGIWRNRLDPLRSAIGQLIFYATTRPFDSLMLFLDKYPYDSLNVSPELFLVFDTVSVKVPVITGTLKSSLPDSLSLADSLNIPEPGIVPDTLRKALPETPVTQIVLKDTSLLIVKKMIAEYYPENKQIPFRVYYSPWPGDSISAAIQALAGFLRSRDSSLIVFKGKSSEELPVWINSQTGKLNRFWLRNEFDDSVTVWIGSISRDTLGIFLEEGIMFRRPSMHTNFSDVQLDIKQINSRKLLEVNKIYVKPQYWKYRSEAAFVFNQTYLTNWVKGGENSISTALDITGFADYNNKDLKLVSNNFARLKYGLIKPGDKHVRKNLDLLETNSKLNHKAFGKFDFSATMLFKTQIAKGYNYPNDSVPVSKFFNPATLTIGFGLDYKPNKNTSINAAPLSYKATFVPDTAMIDQTKYGVPKNKRSMHEPGASVQINSEINPFKTVNVKNRIQLFTNYINKPQNIDVDWEMIATFKLNWFTDLRLNTHLIFDDDTKTVVKKKDGTFELDEFGKPKKTARIQFKELLGVSFVFRF